MDSQLSLFGFGQEPTPEKDEKENVKGAKKKKGTAGTENIASADLFGTTSEADTDLPSIEVSEPIEENAAIVTESKDSENLEIVASDAESEFSLPEESTFFLENNVTEVVDEVPIKPVSRIVVIAPQVPENTEKKSEDAIAASVSEIMQEESVIEENVEGKEVLAEPAIPVSISEEKAEISVEKNPATPAFSTFGKKGRKSFKEIDAEVDLIQVPSDEILFSKQYYPISQVAKWFRVNNSLLRFWENEFDILKPRKNRKGDRLFRPEDIKNLQIIYYLLRQKKYTIAGAKKYIRNNRKTVDVNMKVIQTLNDFKSFLLELKANAERQ